MASGAFGLAWRTHVLFHPRLLCSGKVRHCSSVGAVASPSKRVRPRKEESQNLSDLRREGGHKGNFPAWKKFDAKELGIQISMITESTQMVLNRLKKKGYQVYLVGGCVRDLLLKRVPKDFDVITSAELKQVRKAFPHSLIIGKRFPICHVHVDDTVVEVSSFSTCSGKAGGVFNKELRKPPGCNERDYIRWRNCLQRDFTINGLMFDPSDNLVYDYMGGIEDIKTSKVRTVIPARLSFVEDTARILRAVRIAARLGFCFTKEVAVSLKELSCSLLRLDKGRILMEMNYMLAYGSAEASLRVLWRYGLLEILLPVQAFYFVSHGFRRRDGRLNMLLSLFHNLDRLVAPDRPCHSCLWIGILAFHQALMDQPRNPLVVAAFSLAVYSEGSLFEAIEVARSINQPHNPNFHELIDSQEVDSRDGLLNQVIDLAASVRSAVSNMTDGKYLSKAMSKYPQAPSSDLVFISDGLSLRVCRIFECVRRQNEEGRFPKRGRKIQYESLASGNLREIRHVFARIIFDTLYPSI